MFQTIQAIDEAILLWIQNSLRFEFLDNIMIILTYLGEAGAIWLLIAMYLIFIKKDRYTGLYLIIGIGIGYLVNDIIIKNLIMRPRPFVDIPALVPLIVPPSSASFPSGHAVSCFFSAFWLTKHRRAGWSYLLAAIIAFSRPYVGVHYPSDVAAGALLGTIIAFFPSIIADNLGSMSKHTKSD